MTDRMENLVKEVYRRWKKHAPAEGVHLDAEDMSSFFEGRLNPEENARMQAHLVTCDDCSRILALSLNAEAEELKELPEGLLDKVKEILSLKAKASLFEIILRVKENAFEIIQATGDILLGQELVPAPVLRSRQVSSFKDEVTLLKDFKDIRLEVRVENKAGKYFNTTVKAKQKDSSRPFKDIRVTLIREGVELESYLSDSGTVTFEHLLLGKYSLEVTSSESKLAVVVLEIKA